MSSEKGMGPLKLQEGLDKDFAEGTQILINFAKELNNQIGDKEVIITLNDKNMVIKLSNIEQLVEILKAVYLKTKEHMGTGMMAFATENAELEETIKELRNKYEN